ncbi:MAG TPA: response regulator, partial [Bryobacteraceae bacterium]|nr:response regulator [Bryobacteraceae bacterium]
TLEIALGQIGGAAVRVVSSAAEAESVLRTDTQICALVTDVNLPDASGLDLVKWVRSLPSAARLPIVVISGESDPETPRASLGLGADAFFPKPFSPALVRQKVEELICRAA